MWYIVLLTPIALKISVAFEKHYLYKVPLKYFGRIYEMKRARKLHFLLFKLSVMGCVNKLAL